MVSMPLVLLLGVITLFLVRKGGAKSGHMVIGVLFGLALAATPVGAQILSMLHTFTQSAVAAISHAAGGA
jgi:hypothetical protein